MQQLKIIERIFRIIVNFTIFLLFTCAQYDDSNDPLPINFTPEKNRIAPKAEAGPDTTVEINDSIHLHGKGIDVDSAGGFIRKYEWKFGNSDWVVTSSGDTTIIAPPTAQIYVCSLRVTDNYGLIGVDFVTIRVARTNTPDPIINFETNEGLITLELDSNAAPITVENFLYYVNSGFYNGTIFHGVIKDFMIQGGGFTGNMVKKQAKKPIQNEADNSLKNKKGTIAMARTDAPHSATAARAG